MRSVGRGEERRGIPLASPMLVGGPLGEGGAEGGGEGGGGMMAASAPKMAGAVLERIFLGEKADELGREAVGDGGKGFPVCREVRATTEAISGRQAGTGGGGGGGERWGWGWG